MGKVHADYIQSSFAQHINLLYRIGLGSYWPIVSRARRSFREIPQPCGHLTDKLTNCADDGGAAIIRLWLELSVQAGKPFDLGASTGQVIQGVGHFRWSQEARAAKMGGCLAMEVNWEWERALIS